MFHHLISLVEGFGKKQLVVFSLGSRVGVSVGRLRRLLEGREPDLTDSDDEDSDSADFFLLNDTSDPFQIIHGLLAVIRKVVTKFRDNSYSYNNI